MYSSVEFVVYKLPMSLNDMLTTHWANLEPHKEAWKLFIYSSWLQSRKLVFKKPVRITYILTFETKRDRDYDNYLGGTKYITDALRQCFITRDDMYWLKEISVKFDSDLGKPKTRIIIEEEEEASVKPRETT